MSAKPELEVGAPVVSGSAKTTDTHGDAGASARRVLEILPTSGWRAVDLREIWEYRELLHILVWRDLKVRYRQTLLGAVWVLGQPLLSMAIFTLLFNRMAKIPGIPGLPYPIFVMAGLLPWNFLAAGAQNSGNSLIGSSHLISKIYFPRLIIPMAAVFVGLVDFLVSFVLLGGLMVWYRVPPRPGLLFLPILTGLVVVLAMGMGLWLSALNVQYRDVRVAVPFVLQVAMYATPVVYPLALLPARFQPWALANPMTGVVEGFRAALTGSPLPLEALTVSVLVTLVLLVSGAFYFRRMERFFADVI